MANEVELAFHLYDNVVSFAEPIKRICENVLDLPRENLFGTDAQKNQVALTDSAGNHKTYRQIMQEVGSFFRQYAPDVWVNLLLKEIMAVFRDDPIVIVDDVRFSNEVKAIQSAGGRVVRLLRGGSDDSHVSETALDGFAGFDAVVDNRNQSLNETVSEVLGLVKIWRKP